MKLKTFWVILLVSVLFSCRKEPNTDDLKLEQVVATDRDLAAVFSGYSTYFISDTVSIVASSPNRQYLNRSSCAANGECSKNEYEQQGIHICSPYCKLLILVYGSLLLRTLPEQQFAAVGGMAGMDYYPPWYWGVILVVDIIIRGAHLIPTPLALPLFICLI